MRTNGYAALDVIPEAEEAHQQALHEALRTTVYGPANGSGYYFGLPGVNTFCWPWSTARLVKRLRAFSPDVYTWTLPGVLPPPRAAQDGLPTAPLGRP